MNRSTTLLLFGVLPVGAGVTACHSSSRGGRSVRYFRKLHGDAAAGHEQDLLAKVD